MSTEPHTPNYLLPDGKVDWEIIWRETGTVTGPNLGWLYYGLESDQIEALAFDELGSKQTRIILRIVERDSNILPEFHWPAYIIALADAVYQKYFPLDSASYFMALALGSELPKMANPNDVGKLLADLWRSMPTIPPPLQVSRPTTLLVAPVTCGAIDTTITLAQDIFIAKSGRDRRARKIESEQSLWMLHQLWQYGGKWTSRARKILPEMAAKRFGVNKDWESWKRQINRHKTRFGWSIDEVVAKNKLVM